jgi:hypothetical protein
MHNLHFNTLGTKGHVAVTEVKRHFPHGAEEKIIGSMDF